MAAALRSLSLYNDHFQTKVIGHLLTDKPFLVNISDILSDEYFEDSIARKWIAGHVLEYFKNYHTTPTLDYFQIETKKLDNEPLRISLIDELKNAYQASKEDDKEYIEKEFTNFCKNQQVKNAIIKSVDLLELGDYDAIKNLISTAVKAGHDRNTGHKYELDVESRYRIDSRSPIPFPYPSINKITQGGFGKGDLVLIFGNPGGGKSWITIDCVAHAAELGYNVVYYTLELSESYVGKRLDARFTEIAVDQLDLHKVKVQETVESIRGRIVIKEFPPRRASLDNIEHHLEQLKLFDDFVPDLIVIDYLDLLKNRTVRKERKEEIDDVYVDAKGLAKELQIPIISPSQVNRSGAQEAVIEGDKAAGSYDKMMISDMSFSLSRKREDKVNGTGRIHIMKNRYGIDGLTYGAKLDLSMGKIILDLHPIDNDDLNEMMNPNKEPIPAGAKDIFEQFRNKNKQS